MKDFIKFIVTIFLGLLFAGLLLTGCARESNPINEINGGIQQSVKDLTDYGLTPNQPPEVLWNFEKFLIGKNGEIVARFAPDITADDERIVNAIEAELAR